MNQVNYGEPPEYLKNNKFFKRLDQLLQAKKYNKNKHYKIYSDTTVTNKLAKIYKQKCGYCESITKPHCDHYRPIGAINKEERHGGYYWLAGEWTNLVCSCSDCNNIKGTKFLLDKKGKRIPKPPVQKEWKANSKSHLNEKPLLLHPGVEDDVPNDHLEFNAQSEIFPKKESARGRYTIDTCSLDRKALNLRRKHRIDVIINNIRRIVNICLEKNINSSPIDEDYLQKTVQPQFNEFIKDICQNLEEREYVLLVKQLLNNFMYFFDNYNSIQFGKIKKTPQEIKEIVNYCWNQWFQSCPENIKL